MANMCAKPQNTPFLDASASLGLGVSPIYQCWKNTAVFQDISKRHQCLRNSVKHIALTHLCPTFGLVSTLLKKCGYGQNLPPPLVWKKSTFFIFFGFEGFPYRKKLFVMHVFYYSKYYLWKSNSFRKYN